MSRALPGRALSGLTCLLDWRSRQQQQPSTATLMVVVVICSDIFAVSAVAQAPLRQGRDHPQGLQPRCRHCQGAIGAASLPLLPGTAPWPTAHTHGDHLPWPPSP